jgi:ParB-like chromosome segregation protein Spo0J
VRLTPEQVKPELVEIDRLRPHPENPRNGDLELIGSSIERHGVFRTIVVSSDDVVLAGNHTYAGAIEKGETQLWISRVPFEHTDPQAREIMLIDNRTADLARYDEAQLLQLLQTFDGDLDGTGYDQEAVDDLLAKLQRDEHMPLDGGQPPSREIVVTCKSQREKKALLKRLTEEGYDCEG